RLISFPQFSPGFLATVDIHLAEPFEGFLNGGHLQKLLVHLGDGDVLILGACHHLQLKGETLRGFLRKIRLVQLRFPHHRPPFRRLDFRKDLCHFGIRGLQSLVENFAILVVGLGETFPGGGDLRIVPDLFKGGPDFLTLFLGQLLEGIHPVPVAMSHGGTSRHSRHAGTRSLRPAGAVTRRLVPGGLVRSVPSLRRRGRWRHVLGRHGKHAGQKEQNSKDHCGRLLHGEDFERRRAKRNAGHGGFCVHKKL
ncbi:MAG: hypothetical protein RL693_1271, partial [Verrucomicrobiota bacterium]